MNKNLFFYRGAATGFHLKTKVRLPEVEIGMCDSRILHVLDNYVRSSVIMRLIHNIQLRTPVITRDSLEAMFENIQANTSWNMDGPMLWGYFFTDQSAEKLKDVVPKLEAQGYRFVDIFVPDLEEGKDEYFFLHVEKEEVHSIDSLHQRNQHLYAFAEVNGLDSYDGMDVGPISDSE